MGKLMSKPKKRRAAEDEQVAIAPDVEALTRAGRVRRSRNRQNNTVLGSVPGRTLG